MRPVLSTSGCAAIAWHLPLTADDIKGLTKATAQMIIVGIHTELTSCLQNLAAFTKCISGLGCGSLKDLLCSLCMSRTMWCFACASRISSRWGAAEINSTNMLKSYWCLQGCIVP